MANRSINLTITCCNPGYTLINNTCRRNHDDDILLRPDSNGTYFYIAVKQTIIAIQYYCRSPPFPLQSDYYANMSNGTLVWASVPVFARKCTRQGELDGCLFKYDNPDEQCANNRKGNDRSSYRALAHESSWLCGRNTGFLCGKCPDGTRADLTLSLCLDCEPWHALLITVIGKQQWLYIFTLAISLLSSCSLDVCSGVCSDHDIQHWGTQWAERVSVLHPSHWLCVWLHRQWYHMGKHADFDLSKLLLIQLFWLDRTIIFPACLGSPSIWPCARTRAMTHPPLQPLGYSSPS